MARTARSEKERKKRKSFQKPVVHAYDALLDPLFQHLKDNLEAAIQQLSAKTDQVNRLLEENLELNDDFQAEVHRSQALQINLMEEEATTRILMDQIEDTTQFNNWLVHRIRTRTGRPLPATFVEQIYRDRDVILVEAGEEETFDTEDLLTWRRVDNTSPSQ